MRLGFPPVPALGGTSSTRLGNNISFVAGTGTALFSSSSQTLQSSLSGSTFGSTTSSPATGFPFGSSHSSGSSPFTFGASSVPAFSFNSIGSTTSSISPSYAQPMFGAPNQIDDQMNVEDSIADDPVQFSVPPVVSFGQPTNIPASPNFMFGSPAAPGGPSSFQLGSQQNNFIPQSSCPFQQAGNLEFRAEGSSFYLGSGGSDKFNRNIMRVRRDKLFGLPAAPGGPSTFQSQQNNFIPQSSSPFQQAEILKFPAGGSNFYLGSNGSDKSNQKIVGVRRDKLFGSPAAPGGPSTFQFGSQQNNFIPQSSSSFQQAGNLEFPAGGSSFYLGSGGSDTDGKSNRKIVRVRRDKLRKK